MFEYWIYNTYDVPIISICQKYSKGVIKLVYYKKIILFKKNVQQYTFCISLVKIFMNYCTSVNVSLYKYNVNLYIYIM